MNLESFLCNVLFFLSIIGRLCNETTLPEAHVSEKVEVHPIGIVIIDDLIFFHF